jgi:hypothetical protein
MKTFIIEPESQHLHSIARAKISVRNFLKERPIEVVSGIFLAFITTILIFQYNAKLMQTKSVRSYYLLICKILKEQV